MGRLGLDEPPRSRCPGVPGHRVGYRADRAILGRGCPAGRRGTVPALEEPELADDSARRRAGRGARLSVRTRGARCSLDPGIAAHACLSDRRRRGASRSVSARCRLGAHGGDLRPARLAVLPPARRTASPEQPAELGGAGGRRPTAAHRIFVARAGLNRRPLGVGNGWLAANLVALPHVTAGVVERGRIGARRLSRGVQPLAVRRRPASAGHRRQFRRARLRGGLCRFRVIVVPSRSKPKPNGRKRLDSIREAARPDAAAGSRRRRSLVRVAGRNGRAVVARCRSDHLGPCAREHGRGARAVSEFMVSDGWLRLPLSAALVLNESTADRRPQSCAARDRLGVRGGTDGGQIA